MTLFRRSSSKMWYSRIEVDKKVYQFSTRTTNKNDARSVEAKFRAEKIKGRTSLTSPTLIAFSQPFLDSLFGGRVSKETRRFYIAHWKPLTDSPLGECRLDHIDGAAIEQFVQWRRKQKVSATTINHALRTLRRALHLAVEWKALDKAPKISLLLGERERDFVLTDKIVEKFEKEDGLIGRLVPFLVDTGLRRREACNLLWDDVNLRDGWIHVVKGKSKFARRRIPLTERAKRILGELPRNGAPVFWLRTRGIAHDWLSHAFLDARRRLNLPDECVLHSTRHTFCTRLGERGADAFAIQRLAGHSSITVSQKYVRPTVSKLDATIATLNPSSGK